MEGLGRVFNVLPVADDVYVSLKDATAVSFVCVNTGGDTWTISEAQDAAGTGAAVLSTVTHLYTSATVGSAWVEVTQAVGSAWTTAGSSDVSVVTISAAELSDGFDWVKCASTSTGTVMAILHDLVVQRNPAKLAALV